METKNLMEGICEQIDRVKNIVKEYEAIPSGNFAASLMKQDIKIAEKARNFGDTIQMLKSYQKLKEWEL